MTLCSIGTSSEYVPTWVQKQTKLKPQQVRLPYNNNILGQEAILWEHRQSVSKALGDFLILEAIYQTNGCVVAIKDDEILQSQATLATEEGVLACPEGAVTSSTWLDFSLTSSQFLGQSIPLFH